MSYRRILAAAMISNGFLVLISSFTAIFIPQLADRLVYDRPFLVLVLISALIVQAIYSRWLFYYQLNCRFRVIDLVALLFVCDFTVLFVLAIFMNSPAFVWFASLLLATPLWAWAVKKQIELVRSEEVAEQISEYGQVEMIGRIKDYPLTVEDQLHPQTSDQDLRQAVEDKWSKL